DFLAAMFRKESLELARIRVLKGQILHFPCLEILPDPAATEKVPTVICRDLVEPCRERPGGVVLPDFLTHFHENFGSGVLSVLVRRQRPPAEPVDRRGVLTVNLAPRVRIPLADP